MARPKIPPAEPTRRVRVRSRRLQDLDAAKLATAYALLAKRLLETSEARKVGEDGPTADGDLGRAA